MSYDQPCHFHATGMACAAMVELASETARREAGLLRRQVRAFGECSALMDRAQETQLLQGALEDRLSCARKPPGYQEGAWAQQFLQPASAATPVFCEWTRMKGPAR